MSGLLQGFGAGLQRVGELWMTSELQSIRDKRLQEYQSMEREEERDFQKEMKAEDRAYQKGEKMDDRQYSEGLLNKQWVRDDKIRAEDHARDLEKEGRLSGQAAYTDTAIENGKKYKVFFDKSAKEIGRVELGEATPSTTRQYLDPVTEAKLDSLNSEIAALQKADLEYDNTGKAARLDSLIQERDTILSIGKDKPQEKPNIISVGYEEDGYRFTGGNPNDPNAWVKIK